MKKSYLIVAIVSLFIIVAVLTNPNQDRHKEVIKNKLMFYMQKSMNESLSDKEDDIKQTSQAFGVILGGVVIDGIIGNLISIDNYVLFSTTKITWEGETKVIGIGAFGNVFVTNKLDEAMSNGLLKER